ncbi:phosphatidylglycerophosphate synthase [Nitzschia inconspicua]|uniref:Phosphatidylglycerophosphate synthase n=1 Tax=Nitzschia inconspicua TaxID=303405 RepID=A0A9K3LN17_9STRA|nr:phosphatidylglycerophosphate synthase [Nitzschia inconspicua]
MTTTTTTPTPTTTTRTPAHRNDHPNRRRRRERIRGRRLAVPLYVPNLMGYTRILLAFWGLYESQTGCPILASWIWLLSASLDLLDGIVARRFDQCSALGVLLDIAADNILRTCLWMAASLSSISTSDDKNNNKSSMVLVMIATAIISLEWITMICTQLHAASVTTTTSSRHWKDGRTRQDPWWIRLIFANGFRTPLGVLCIGGLFGSGYLAYAQSQPQLATMIPHFVVFRNVSFIGRGVAMLAELWLCGRYLSHVIANDDAGNHSSEDDDDAVAVPNDHQQQQQRNSSNNNNNNNSKRRNHTKKCK